ncbi:SemiSWEET transporter [Aestuariirhabdus sp. Z084]|uniref:SemiSWEET family sugar transporter n=1 Tax=Aestuariirhabdus haliotis TaxID=2918751 RepID=UPI00201B3B20|nr:SemiSWEET transporter [Aestuariirhabdus haliotis]MCL6417773.1 SemiSWEET transporter [Aestuariirhabdus haliotis]MCL6421704.1 SemiSWEET transporter [Aestuariirhabdus haliotis]
MNSITLIGLAAACCTTLAFIPQVRWILKTGNVDGISVGMYSIFTTGVALWLLYGLLVWDLPIIAANLVTLLLSLSVLVLTIRHRLRARKK